MANQAIPIVDFEQDDMAAMNLAANALILSVKLHKETCDDPECDFLATAIGFLAASLGLQESSWKEVYRSYNATKDANHAYGKTNTRKPSSN